MRLSNDFSWSFSRQGMFAECPKKYWYTYYGSWEGWPKTPYDKRRSIDPLAARLYALKQMQTIPTFVGTVVHNTIEYFLKRGSKFSLEELQEYAKERFTRGLHEAETGIWKVSPKKHTNLFEFYYENGVSEESKKSAQEKITLCLSNWYNSQIVQELLFHKAVTVKSVEALEFYMLEELYKVVVIIDLALIWQGKNRSYILFDWKTGQESEKTREQLYCYALFANTVWNVPLEEIVLVPFYLFSNTYQKIGAQHEEKIDEKLLAATKEAIIASSKTLSVVHADQDITKFPYTQEREKCKKCVFKEVCEKAGYEELTREKLTRCI